MSDDTDQASIERLAGLAQSLATDPETRESFLRLVKKKNPKLAIPEIDAADRAREAVAQQHSSLEKKVAELEERLQKNAAFNPLVAEREALVRARGEDEVKKIETLMLERKIGSYATAAEYVDLEKRVATPTQPLGLKTAAQLPKLTDTFLKNPVSGARDLAAQAVNDLITARARGEAIQ